MRPGPLSFSLAKTKIVSPLAMCLPLYIVFCALNANVSAHGSLTSALIANIILLSRTINFHGRHGARPNETKLSHRWRQRAWIAMVGFLTSSGRRLLAHAWNALLRPHERFNRVLVRPTPWRALGSCADRRQPADISPPAHRRSQSLHQPALRRAIRCSHRGTSVGVRSHARCGTCCRESGAAPIARRADLARPPRARSCHRRAALALRADHQDNNDKAGRCGYDAAERVPPALP